MLRRAVLAAVLAALLLPRAALANPAGELHPPNLQTVIRTNQFSIAGTVDARELRYTHLVYNAGPGPLEIQPSYSSASGNYTGQQQLYTHDASNRWSLVSTRAVPDAFVFHAEHGHFHFPLAAFGLYAVAADGGIGAPVALSPKVGFCISDSYIYDSTVVHAGAFVGSLWPVTDDVAVLFARVFYERLAAGVPLGEAMRQAREEVRRQRPADPTWLAYCCFADPLARRDSECR